jgi:hypothetical protein
MSFLGQTGVDPNDLITAFAQIAQNNQITQPSQPGFVGQPQGQTLGQQLAPMVAALAPKAQQPQMELPEETLQPSVNAIWDFMLANKLPFGVPQSATTNIWNR